MTSEARFPLTAEWARIQEAINDPEKYLSIGELHPQGYLAAFPLRVDWEATLPRQGRDPYPAPEYTSRDAQAVEMPSAIAKLAQMACEASWEVRAQSSMGSFPHGSTGRPTAAKRTIALRFGAHPMTDRQAYVLYESPVASSAWKVRSIMIWGPDLPPYAHVSLAGLKTYLAEVGIGPIAELKRWVAEIERLRTESESFRKRRASARAQIRKVADEGRFRAGVAEDRATFDQIDREWRSKVADLQDGLFTSDEVAIMIDPSRKRSTGREGAR